MAGQWVDIPPPSRRRRERGEIWQSSPITLTRGWHEIPVGVMGWVRSVPVAAQKRGGDFFPLHTGLRSELAVGGQFSKSSTFFKGRVAAVAVQTLSWIECFCVLPLADMLTPRMWYQTIPRSLGAFTSMVGYSLAPLHFWCFHSLFLLSKDEAEPAAAGGSVGFPMRCCWYIFSSPSLCQRRALKHRGPEGVCRSCSAAGARGECAGVRTSTAWEWAHCSKGAAREEENGAETHRHQDCIAFSFSKRFCSHNQHYGFLECCLPSAFDAEM